MRFCGVFLGFVVCISICIGEVRSESPYEDSGSLMVEILESAGDLVGGSGIGDMIKDMATTLKVFTQIGDFLNNEENIRHIMFILSAIENSMLDGCSVWKDPQEMIEQRGLSEYVIEVRKKILDRIRGNPELPNEIMSIFNQRISPLFDEATKIIDQIDLDMLPFKPRYSHIANVIKLLSDFRVMEIFNPEMIKQAIGTVGNPMNMLTNEIEKHLSPDQVRILLSVIKMMASNQKIGQRSRDKEEL